MNFSRTRRTVAIFSTLPLLSVLATYLVAQAAPTLPPTGAAASDTPKDTPVVLTPFEVSTSSDVGYEARDTLNGSRLNTSLRNVASQVQVMTPEFLRDLAITDLNDAIAYSLNTETSAEILDVSATGNGGNEGSIQAFAGAPRTRGINSTTIGRDFFNTFMPVDVYNTERFTFAAGANNTLFGNATPAGSIDTTTKRARLDRQMFTAEYRVDSNGSQRAMLDLNQPMIKNTLGVRWVGLRDRANDFREPSFRDQNRQFVAMTFTPLRQVSIRGWYEHYDEHGQPLRNTLLRDRVSDWIAAGRPAFNNAAVGGTFPPGPVSTASPFIRIPAARTNPVYFFDGSGGLGGQLYQIFNTVQTVGQQNLGAVPNNFDRSLVDESIVPRDVAYAGNGVQNLQRGRSAGAVINANPVKNLFLEFAQSREFFKHRFVDLFKFSELTLFADANRFLNDRVTPNPNLGRYYIEDTITFGGATLNAFDQQRVSAAYQLDFTERTSWLKWFGHHNVTGFYDRLIQDNTGPGQRFDPHLVNPAGNGIVAGAPGTVFFRYYLPDAQHPGPVAVNLPFNPLQEGLIELPNSGGAKITGYNSSFGADGGAFPSRTIVHSRAFAWQGFLLKDRVVLGYSWRSDTVMRASVDTTEVPFPRVGPGFGYIDKVYDLARRNQYVQTNIGNKTKGNRSVVVHPFKWLSAHYAQLGNGQVTGLERLNLDGTDVELGTGAGKEIGFTLRLLQDRLSIRVNKYETSLIGTQVSSLGGGGATNNVPTATAGGGNMITDDLPALEQAALQAGAPKSQKYGYWDDLLLQVPWPGRGTGDNPATPGFATARGIFDFIADRQSKGYEVTIVGNPTPQWRLAISGSQNENKESNHAPQYFDLIKERLPIWSQYLNAPTYRNNFAAGGQTLGQLLQASIGNFYFIQRAAGQPNVMDRKYRVTLTSSYSIRESWLKGVRVGANYIWRSPAAVAFNPVTVTDNPFRVPGLTTSTLTLNDPLSPIRGGPIISFDAFAGYGRRLFKNKIRWDVQLNVRNVLDRDGLLVQRAYSTGEPTVFTVQQPRTVILTNTFSF